MERLMEPVVQKLILQRFRSIPNDEITFDNPMFLIGRNGSGKSNFVDAFAFLAEAMTTPLQTVLDKRGGIATVRYRGTGREHPANVGLGVTFGPLNGSITQAHYAIESKAEQNHSFRVVREQCVVWCDGDAFWFDRSTKRFRSNIAGVTPSLEETSLALPVVGGESRLAPVLRTLSGMRVYSIEPLQLRLMHDPDSGQSLRPDGGNAASVLLEIKRRSPDDHRRIEEFLSAIVPNTTHVNSVKHGSKLSLEFTQEWSERKRQKFEADSMSDGTLRALGMLTAVFQHPTPTVLVIEEPEATMHPGALGAMMDLLRHASRITQVVVTTHSPEILDASWLEARHLRSIQWEAGVTRIIPLSNGTRQILSDRLQTAGELLRSNALRGQLVSTERIPTPPLFVEISE